MRKLAVALACASALGGPGVARAEGDAGATRATMTCDPAPGPGRVRCEVEARVAEGDAIAWGDVVIVETPPFVGALRGRIGPSDATVHEPGLWRWALALVARERGAGEVHARVRLVVCHDGRCEPRELSVTGQVMAGR